MLRATGPILLCLVAARPAVAQVSVAGTRDLAFGFLTLGVTSDVPPIDPIKSGQWSITAPLNQRIQVRLTVPANLVGPAGATLPLTVKNNYALLQGTWPGAVGTYFNPPGNVNFRFTGGTGAILRLGGSITPAANQRTGAYTNDAIVTITVF